MTYRVIARENFGKKSQRVWWFDDYDEAIECARRKESVHRRRGQERGKVYSNVTVRDERGIKCLY